MAAIPSPKFYRSMTGDLEKFRTEKIEPFDIKEFETKNVDYLNIKIHSMARQTVQVSLHQVKKKEGAYRVWKMHCKGKTNSIISTIEEFVNQKEKQVFYITERSPTERNIKLITPGEAFPETAAAD